MYMRRHRTGRQLLISILIGLSLVTVLAILVGTLDRTPLIIATLVMTAFGLLGIWFFENDKTWSWPSEIADYLTIVGMIGFWTAVSDQILSWIIAVIFYWGLATLVKRAREAVRA